jgi:hypothetical protein
MDSLLSPGPEVLEYPARLLPANGFSWNRRGGEVEFTALVRDEQNKKLESLEVKV